MSVGLDQRPESDAPLEEDQEPPVGPADRAITAGIVGAPFVAVVFGLVWFWGRGVHLRDVLLAVALFFLVGHGITIGFHRMLAHRSFVACRPVKLALLALGSMAFQGGPIGWVADHRRHHVFSDLADDPHSPHRYGSGAVASSGGCGMPRWAGCSRAIARRGPVTPLISWSIATW